VNDWAAHVGKAAKGLDQDHRLLGWGGKGFFEVERKLRKKRRRRREISPLKSRKKRPIAGAGDIKRGTVKNAAKKKLNH